MPRRNPKRRNGGGRFAMLPVALLEDPAVTTLSHAAFRVLVLLAGQFHGRNNGGLGLTVAQAERAGIRSETTLYAALRELERRGLITKTYAASRVPPRPTMYALAWRPVDATEYSCATRVAGNEFRHWRPCK